MDSGKGNIMNRKIKSNIRDKNFTFNNTEEAKISTQQTYKEKKMNEIQEHRRKALLGNKQERMQVTTMYKNECVQLDNARQQKMAFERQ